MRILILFALYIHIYINERYMNKDVYLLVIKFILGRRSIIQTSYDTAISNARPPITVAGRQLHDEGGHAERGRHPSRLP